jgi:hypothetical protein
MIVSVEKRAAHAERRRELSPGVPFTSENELLFIIKMSAEGLVGHFAMIPTSPTTPVGHSFIIATSSATPVGHSLIIATSPATPVGHSFIIATSPATPVGHSFIIAASPAAPVGHSFIIATSPATPVGHSFIIARTPNSASVEGFQKDFRFSCVGPDNALIGQRFTWLTEDLCGGMVRPLGRSIDHWIVGR